MFAIKVIQFKKIYIYIYVYVPLDLFLSFILIIKEIFYHIHGNSPLAFNLYQTMDLYLNNVFIFYLIMTYILRVWRVKSSTVRCMLYSCFRLALYTRQDTDVIKLYGGEIHFGYIVIQNRKPFKKQYVLWFKLKI